jgi:cell division protein FtsL
MVRVNVFLLLAAVLCALSVVTSQHKARKLFQAMESEQERARQLDIEFDQLQLELSTWATSPRIDKIARENLKMHPAGSPAAGHPAGTSPGLRPVAAPVSAHVASPSPAARPAAKPQGKPVVKAAPAPRSVGGAQ